MMMKIEEKQEEAYINEFPSTVCWLFVNVMRGCDTLVEHVMYWA
jgi:hypothetical protein